MKVTITKDKLSEAAAKGIIDKQQEEGLWNFLIEDSNKGTEASSLSESAFVKMLYYSGTFIIIGAMGWFMNRAWDTWHGAGVALIALLYALGFILTGRYVSSKSGFLSNLFYVMAVAMTPLFTYGIQKWLGFWPNDYPGDYRSFHRYIKSGWLTMELVTLIVSTAALRYIKIPMAMAIPAFVLWYISMDIAPILFGQDYNWTVRKYVSVIFGLCLTMVAFIIDSQKRMDYAKWLYIVGGLSFWGGMTVINSTDEWSKLVYFIINIAMMCIGTLLERKVFIILGSLGCIGYLGHLAYSLFRSFALFPILLAGFGLFIILIGWLCHKNRDIIKDKIIRVTPQAIIARLPQHRK